MEEIKTEIIKKQRGRPRKPENENKVQTEKKPKGRPRVRPIVIKNIGGKIGKPLNTKNGYKKDYSWEVIDNNTTYYFKNISDIAVHLKCSPQRVNRVIYGNVIIPNVTIDKKFNLEV